MENKQKCEKLAAAAPPVSKREIEQLNALFPSYIFRRWRTREVWTSCCGIHDFLPDDHPVMAAEHTPMPKPTSDWYCHMGAMSAPVPKAASAPMACPFCGRMSPVKELGRTGGRQNLRCWRRAVVLRWHRGALWAQAVDLCKSYETMELLTARPSSCFCGVYRFTPGRAVCALRRWWTGGAFWREYRDTPAAMTPKGILPEPFNCCSYYGIGYDLIGEEEVKKSPFCWCGIHTYAKEHYRIIGFLSLCTAFPRQVEMLIKLGLGRAVEDFISLKKTNARVMDWNETNPVKAFGLDKPELTQFLLSEKNFGVLYRYKLLKKAGVPVSFHALDALWLELGGETFNRIAAKLARYRCKLDRLLRYIQTERDRVRPKKSNKDNCPTLADMAGWWVDYVDAALVLGYNLANPVFLLPKGLATHHDEATRAASAILESRRSDASTRLGRERCRQLSVRYTYSDGRWLIRPPTGAAEIVAEGKALRHCVGGYADRHLRKRTTILFLRDRKRPGKSLVTIEMHGAEIAQIHGWDDERTACTDNPKRKPPREIYAQFLDQWLAWVAAGSKRDKQGRPIVLKNKKVGAA